MSDWKALAGRITLFAGSPPSGPSLTALDLFQKVWSGNPDAFQSSPNPLVPSFARGKRRDLTVGCVVQPTRIDFNINPPPPPTLPAESLIPFIQIEDTSQLHAALEQVIKSINELNVTNSINRVGLFLHFLRLAPGIEAANKTLVSVMPNQYGARITTEEDFIFQINRPHVSNSVREIKINCVVKWNVDRFQVFNVAIAMNAPVVDSRTLPSQPGQEYIAASVVFDINNVITRALDASEQTSLLAEGLTEAKKMQRDLGLNVEGF